MSAELSTIAKKKFTEEEVKLLGQLTKPGGQISVLVPDQIDPKEWRATTNVVCRALVQTEIKKRQLMPVLGRLLVIAKATQEIWSKFEKFEDFLEAEIYTKFQISRSSCYEAMQSADRFGHLEIAECEAIPRRNMKVVLAAVVRGEEKKGYAKEVLEKAAELSESDLKDWCVQKKYLEHGETTGAFLKVPCNAAQLKRFKKFFANPEYAAYCGASTPAVMLERAIQEATTEWTVQTQEPQEASTAA